MYNQLEAYSCHLTAEERAPATIEKYIRETGAFLDWLNGVEISKEQAVKYKQFIAESRAVAGVNAVVAALNKFFAFLGLDIKIKPLKIQRQTFTRKEKELSREEYTRLLKAACKSRLYYVMQTVCATGIRISELKYITMETVRDGQAVITNKGKTRIIFIPGKLQYTLLQYAKEHDIIEGCIFVTRTGKPLDRRNIWADMKKLCKKADVDPEKVFPHNLRRLFAREFYSLEKDLNRLADLLGHSDVNTTRIYLKESGKEHQRIVERLSQVLLL
jgi:site-specific recombinase XerD